MAPRPQLPDPDADLVHAALRGAKESLAELVSRHRDTAVFLAARVLGSLELAQDAAQEAAVAAMTDLGRLRSPERFGAWYCGIALNVARRWLRQLRAERIGGPADGPGRGERPGGQAGPASSTPGPAELVEKADIAARVRGAIAALPAGQRDTVLLFYLQGLSHREVASELRISVSAVKSRLHQARAALAPRLALIVDLPEVRTMTPAQAVEWDEVFVSEIRRSDDQDATRRKHVMVLQERSGPAQLPIWVGPAEATSLALVLESVESPRPFTYKLAAGLVDAADSHISEVRITRLIDSVFYAVVVVQGPRGPREVDARPSDAVNLALVAEVPIRVDRRLFTGLGGWPCAAVSARAATAEIAGEAQQRMDELARELEQCRESGAR
jgi:RNA polymerase sigma factor (sigma-70 family)